jgi:hypothetical protein
VIDPVNDTLAGIGMRNIFFRLVITANIRFIHNVFRNFKTTAVAYFYAKCLFGNKMICAGKKWFKAVAITNRTF